MSQRNREPNDNPWMTGMFVVTGVSGFVAVVLACSLPVVAVAAGAVFATGLLAMTITKAVTWELKHRDDTSARPADTD